MAPARRRHWPSDPGRYHWIVDGHNAIFAHPELERLQTEGEKGEARRRLEQLLERFAARHHLSAEIVYDGNRLERNPDTYRGPAVSTIYTLAPEEADDRIVYMAGARIARGDRVVVVSSDLRTLGFRLPAGVVQVEPFDLYARLRAEGEALDQDVPVGDFTDVEELLLAREEHPCVDDPDEPPAMTPKPLDLKPRDPPRPAGPVIPGRPTTSTGRSHAHPSTKDRSRIEAKRERGRERHERRLSRWGPAGRRRDRRRGR